MSERILVVDDERGIRLTFESFLSDDGYDVDIAASFEEAVDLLSKGRYDVVFADIVLGGKTGIDLLRELRNHDALCPVIMITGYPNIESASEALRLGAFDYIAKPVVQETLLRVAKMAVQHRTILHERERYRANLEAIFKSVKEAIITVDDDMKVTELNAAAESICGLSRSAIGRALDDVELQCGTRCQDALRETVERRATVELSRVECGGRSGTPKVISLTTSPLVSGEDRISGAVLIVRDETRLADLERDLAKRDHYYKMVGKSEKLQRVYSLIDALADYQTTVLITGESGTGKELVADALHYSGSRRDKHLVKINCSALNEDLLESELFGHVRGAFTGAVRDKIGRFQKADGGTIFLDEIGEVSPRIQVKLLRVLQDMEFERVGDTTPIKVDVRLIAATNQDLRKKVHEGKFREDLYYRLKVVELNLPPLRERLEDIPLLAAHFIEKFNKKLGRAVLSVSSDVLEAFMRYPWPGNIRELEHVIEHSYFLCQAAIITADSLPLEFAHLEGPGRETTLFVQEGEGIKEGILRALEKTGWNKARAASLLGMSRSTIYRKIQEYDIESSNPFVKKS